VAPLAAVVLFAWAAPAIACKTPVYRFAMYNWERATYRVYYFHRGSVAAEDVPVHAALVAAAKAKPAGANVELFSLDVSSYRGPGNGSGDEALKALPPELRDEVRQLLDVESSDSSAKGDAATPGSSDAVGGRTSDGKAASTGSRYVVVTPLGGEMFRGPLRRDDVAALVDSPARAKMNAMLAGGKAGVLVLLTGKDRAANQAAQAVVEQVVRDAASGAIQPPDVDPTDADADKNDARSNDPAKKDAAKKDAAKNDAGGDDNKSRTLEIGTVTVARDDPREAWLVRSLLQVEDELTERTEPMVFSVYGRGRANPPHVGKGITVEQLTAQVRFLLGPCACTIKRENPGADLITRYDWKAAALALAERFGTETGNEHLLGDAAFPRVFPSVTTTPTADAKTNGANQRAPADADKSTATVAKEPSTSPTDGDTNAERPSSDVETSSADAAHGGPMMRNLGLGVAVALCVLALASLMLLRPRG
jgi:hypothetical protein